MAETSKTRNRAVLLLSAIVVLALVFAYLVLRPNGKPGDVLHSPKLDSPPSTETSSVERRGSTASRKANIDRLRSLSKGLQLSARRANGTSEAVTSSSNSDEAQLISPLARIPSFAHSDSDRDTENHALKPSDLRMQNLSPNENVIENLKRMGNAEHRARIREILRNHRSAGQDTAQDSQ